MSTIETAAVILGVLCVALTIRRNIWCWPAGLGQVILYIFIFYDAKLYSDMILQVIYVFMQIYGWYFWLHGGEKREAAPLTTLRVGLLAGWIAGTALVSAIWGFAMSHTDASFPYGDSVIASASLTAQWLMSRKKVESWYFWVGVDILAVYIYYAKELYLTAGLYALFLVLAVIGLVSWKKAVRSPVLAERCA